MNDVQKLRQLADKLSTALDNTKALNAQSQTTENTEQRKNIRPDIDRKDVVFADDGGGIGYSVDDTYRLENYTKKKLKIGRTAKK